MKLNDLHVLVVDHSPMTRVVAKNTLRSFGVANVYEASDGHTALEIIQNNEIDVVFSDWNMPVMDGLSLLTEIRKNRPQLPVVMISAEGSKEKILQAIQAGANDYLLKPFTPARLREKLGKWVGIRSPVHV